MSFDVEQLLQPISEEAPCGADLSYDPDFLALEAMASGSPEQQMGDQVIEAKDPDWGELRSRSLELAGKSKDLRVLLYVALSHLKLEGLDGFRDALNLLRRTLETYWDDVYPKLDPEDDNDPTERKNILETLSPPVSEMSDQDPMRFKDRFMDVAICKPGDRRLKPASLRDVLVASGKLSSSEGDAAGDGSLVDAAFEATTTEDLQTIQGVLQAVGTELETMVGFLREKMGVGVAPTFAELSEVVGQAGRQVATSLASRGYGDAAEEEGGGQPQQGQALSGQITSTQDVLKALDKVSEYYERNEPSSPIPLLMKRAKKLVGKTFVDIIMDISPDAMSQVEYVSGKSAEE
jgi:type VI secretion system protein ImpA